MRRLSTVLLPAAAAAALVLVPGAQGAGSADGTRRIAATKLSSYQLRMSAGRVRTVQLDDAAITVKAGQTITIRFRCAAPAKRPKQVGTTVSLCLDRGRGGLSEIDVLADAGAVVTLTSDGTALTRLGYGSRRGAPAF